MVKFAIRLTKYDARSYRSTLSLRGSRWAVLGLCVLALRVMRTPPPPRLRNDDENHRAQHGWTFRQLKARIYTGSQMIRVTSLNALSRVPLRSSFDSDFSRSSLDGRAMGSIAVHALVIRRRWTLADVKVSRVLYHYCCLYWQVCVIAKLQ
jgi:hypothetical protein